MLCICMHVMYKGYAMSWRGRGERFGGRGKERDVEKKIFFIGGGGGGI